MYSTIVVEILLLKVLIALACLSYAAGSHQQDEDIDMIIWHLKNSISINTISAEDIEWSIEQVQDWTIKKIENGEYDICISKLKSYLEIIENTLADTDISISLSNRIFELKAWFYDIIELRDDQNKLIIEKVSSEISPGDHLIRLNSSSEISPGDPLISSESAYARTGVVYYGKERHFAGYVPTELLIHQGQNIVSIDFSYTEYYVEFTLKGTVLSVDKANARIVDDCWSPTLLGTKNMISWGQKLHRSKSDLRIKSFIIETQRDVDAQFNCRYNLNYGKKKYFMLKVTSEPPNAEIWIDNKYMGNTPKALLISKNWEKVNIEISTEKYIKLAKSYTFKRKISEIHFKLTPKSNIGLTKK